MARAIKIIMKPETIERKRLEREENKKRERELFLKNYEIAKSVYPYLPEPPLEGNSMSYNNEEDDTSTIITSNGVTHF